jgi:tetratricopeptide (TPR) repeat protein
MYRNGDPEGALKMYVKAIEADPRTPHPHYNTARILSERKELDKAIQSYRQATEVDSEYVLGFRALGEAFEGKGDYAAAMKYYKRVVGLSFDPSYWPSKVEQMITFLTGSGLPY